MAKKINKSVTNILIPKHRKISEEEFTVLAEKYSLDDKLQLPKIKRDDIALVDIGCEIGDVIEITRNSFAGENKYFRVVVD